MPPTNGTTTASRAGFKRRSTNAPLPELRSIDESPYRTAIAAGVKLVMTSWAIYPALVSRITRIPQV